MNKKQKVISYILLVLILIIGGCIIATKLNADLDYVAGNDMSSDKKTISSNDSTTSKTGNSFFQEGQMVRDNNNTRALQNLKALIDDEHTSKEVRADLSKKYTNLALAISNQNQIETILNSKGYEEVLSYVQDNKVTIIIKVPNELTEAQQNQIKNVVIDVTHIKDVEIQHKE